MPHARAPKPNRSDLTKAPVTTVPGQTYGLQAAQRAAQQQIPLGVAQAPPGRPPGQAQGVTPSALPGAPMVGSSGPLTRPTERPNEPVTAGLPQGPGPGPEGLQGIGAAARQNAVEQGTLSHLLTSLAARPNATSAIKDLAARATQGVM